MGLKFSARVKPFALALCVCAASAFAAPAPAEQAPIVPYFILADEVPDADESLPLLRTAAYGDLEAMKALIAEDTALTGTDAKGRNVMHVLAMRGALEQMKLLLLLQPDLAIKEDAQGWVPLYIAYANGHFALAEYMQKGRYDHVNRPSATGLPRSFHFVMHLDQPAALEAMIEDGLNLFKRTRDDKTLQQVAFEAGQELSARVVDAHYEVKLKQYREKLQKQRLLEEQQRKRGQ